MSNQLVNRYVAVWNESDAELRRKAIAELWVEDGAHIYSQRACSGYDALEERIAEAYEEFVKKGGFVFRLSSEVESHHDAVKFTWEMVPAGGGAAVASGFDFLLLSDDGRIRFDYQF
uniref:SnoaL-like domain-containing protein n=1 Tax=Thermosporothrix sp. COM3 TaxID=2490863 RepID=A0A455SLY5_9CHLR|nr:hypothetical protein KTC_26730 [Thermosporothrix sp. COM3]